MNCPNHVIDEIDQLYIFIGGVKGKTKVMFDAATGGRIIKNKTLEEAIKLIENMASNDFKAQHDRAPTSCRGVMELNSQDAIMAQVKALKVQMPNLPQHLIKVFS